MKYAGALLSLFVAGTAFAAGNMNMAGALDARWNQPQQQMMGTSQYGGAAYMPADPNAMTREHNSFERGGMTGINQGSVVTNCVNGRLVTQRISPQGQIIDNTGPTTHY